MPRIDRVNLIRQIQESRGSTVICYLTSLRPNVPGQMAEDAVRVIFDHLLRLPSRPVPKLDIFLCSNGGSGTVPWRLVSLFREFASSIAVLVPYRAYSAASLLALGADEIVMHPFAELGPIDPTVSNDFNPVEQGSGRRLGISIEDVYAYINFVKSSVGITHQDELVKAVEILANKVHPLALGNVERFWSQSRLIAKKILRTHMKDADEHSIKEVVENMASKLYFHGHPINRMEAKEDLKLKVLTDIPPQLETAMWSLYTDYEAEFENLIAFDPAADLAAMPIPAQPMPSPQSTPAAPPEPKTKSYTLVHAMIESESLSSRYTTQRRYRDITGLPPGQAAIQEEKLSQGWSHSEEVSVEYPMEQSLTDTPGAQEQLSAPQARRTRKPQPPKE